MRETENAQPVGRRHELQHIEGNRLMVDLFGRLAINGEAFDRYHHRSNAESMASIKAPTRASVCVEEKL